MTPRCAERSCARCALMMSTRPTGCCGSGRRRRRTGWNGWCPTLRPRGYCCRAISPTGRRFLELGGSRAHMVPRNRCRKLHGDRPRPPEMTEARRSAPRSHQQAGRLRRLFQHVLNRLVLGDTGSHSRPVLALGAEQVVVRINEHDRSTLWIAFHCLLPFTNCADEGGLSARECLSENRIRDGPSLIRVGAISLHVATHPIGMLGLVAVT